MASLLRVLSARAAPAAPALTRGMASKVAPSVFGATGKLATKLFAEGKKAKNLPLIRTELRKFKDMYEHNSELRSMFLNPIMTTEQRNSTLTKVFKANGLKSNETLAFIKGAAATKNLGRIKQIVSDFDKLVTYELKEVHASVTSAEPLQASQLQRLEAALKKKISSDEKLLLTTKVEPSILGGVIVLLDQQMLDLSVSGQIRKIDAAMRV